MVRRYFYNGSSMACEPFQYGGCLGNGNNFVSEKECLQTCRTVGESGPFASVHAAAGNAILPADHLPTEPVATRGRSRGGNPGRVSGSRRKCHLHLGDRRQVISSHRRQLPSLEGTRWSR